MQLMSLHKYSHGFTLIEVLVAMVILAIGLLGVASLQLTSFQSSYRAQLRTTVNYEISAVIDIMRANLDEIEKGTSSVFQGPNPAATIPDCQGNSKNCTSSGMASYQLNEWLTRLRDRLPSGSAAIEIEQVNETLGGLPAVVYIADIKIFWDEDKTGVSGTGCDPTDADDLACLNIAVRVHEDFITPTP